MNEIILKPGQIDLYDEGYANAREPYYEDDSINWNFREMNNTVLNTIIERAGLSSVYAEALKETELDAGSIYVDMYLSVNYNKEVSIDIFIKSEGETIDNGEGEIHLNKSENKIALTAIEKFLINHEMSSLDTYLAEIELPDSVGHDENLAKTKDKGMEMA